METYENEFEDVIEEVTERVVLEEQLRQAQKMEAVGQLASPAALLEINEINNVAWRTPLTALADAKRFLRKLANPP